MQRDTNICACLLTVFFCSVVYCDSLEMNWSRKSLGVTADMSHFNLFNTIVSHVWKQRKNNFFLNKKLEIWMFCVSLCYIIYWFFFCWNKSFIFLRQYKVCNIYTKKLQKYRHMKWCMRCMYNKKLKPPPTVPSTLTVYNSFFVPRQVLLMIILCSCPISQI